MRKIHISVALLFAFANISGICRGEDRSQLTPRKALLGHWGKKGEASERYYSLSTFIIVDKFGERKARYMIASAHGDELKVKQKVLRSWYATTYKFSPDRNSFSVGSEDWFVEFIYIDDKQKPDKD